jgi:hypothetical protein
LRQFFSKKFKVNVAKVFMSCEKPMIVFDEEILRSGYIKACFKLGLKARHSRYKRIEDEEFQRK